MLSRFGLLAGAFLVLILSFALTGLLGPLGFPLAGFAPGLAATALGRIRYGDWSPGTITIFGYVGLFFLTPLFLAAAITGMDGPYVPIYLVGGLVVAVAAYLALRRVFSFISPRAAGRDGERRSLAAGRWEFQAADDTALDELREATRQLRAGSPAAGPDGPAHLAGARAVGVVRGRANGLAFTAFDYFFPQLFREPLVSSVCVVRLPRPVPAYRPVEGTPCLFCGPEPHLDGRHPDVDGLIAQLRGDWWVAGPWLVWQGIGYGTLGSGPQRYDRGVSAIQLMRSIDAATKLAAMIDGSPLSVS